MLPAVRPLTAGLLVMVTLLTGCGGTSDEKKPNPPIADSTSISASPEVDAASTAPARQPHTLVLTATGTARIDKFTYVLDGKATEGGSARLPWRQSVDVPADGRRHEWSLTVRFRNGEVKLLAIFNGQESARANGSSSGAGTANVGGSVLG